MSIRNSKSQIVTVDNLAQKREQLELFRGQFAATVAMVTQTIDDLSALNCDIGQAIDEIDDYLKSLEGLRVEMVASKTQNEQIIHNFRTLLNLE